MHCAEKPDIDAYVNVNEELYMVEWDSDDEFLYSCNLYQFNAIIYVTIINIQFSNN